MLPGYAQHTRPMLSTLPTWDFGSHGALDGSYALKMATRPKRGAHNVAIKRLTFRKRGPIRVEFYFTFKPEANELRLSETDVRSVGFLYDLQDDTSGPGHAASALPQRHDGEHLQKWQFKQTHEPFKPLGTEQDGDPLSTCADQDWEDMPGGEQRLCYNEIPTKVNWHYCASTSTSRRCRPRHFQCNDCVFDMTRQGPIRIPAMRNLWCMLNFVFFVETDTDKRALPLSRFGLPLGGFLISCPRAPPRRRPQRDLAGGSRPSPTRPAGRARRSIFVRALKPSGDPAAPRRASRSRPTACTGPRRARASPSRSRSARSTFARVAPLRQLAARLRPPAGRRERPGARDIHLKA